MAIVSVSFFVFFFFFFNDTATTEIYTLSLHDALPIFRHAAARPGRARLPRAPGLRGRRPVAQERSEEHTSELQSHVNLVCRLLLEKKKKKREKKKKEQKEEQQMTQKTNLDHHDTHISI